MYFEKMSRATEGHVHGVAVALGNSRFERKVHYAHNGGSNLVLVSLAKYRRSLRIAHASDRSRKNAPKVFNGLFPGAQQITLGAVPELRYTPVWSMATPPTLEDRFLELHHDRVISKEECAEFVRHSPETSRYLVYLIN